MSPVAGFENLPPDLQRTIADIIIRIGERASEPIVSAIRKVLDARQTKRIRRLQAALDLMSKHGYADAVPLFKSGMPAMADMMDRAAIRLLLARCLLHTGQLKDALRQSRQALKRATNEGHQPLRRAALNLSGIVHDQQQRFAAAQSDLSEALKIARREGDAGGQAAALCNLGLLYRHRGDLDKAEDHHKKALAIHEQIGSPLGQAENLGNLGLVYRHRGDLDKAEEHHKKALAIDRCIGNRLGEANQLANLGNVYANRGELDRAEEHYSTALAMHRQVDNRLGEANDLGNLANLYVDRGELDKARHYHEKALATFRQIGNRLGEAHALNNLGIVYAERGDLDKASGRFKQALQIHQEIGNEVGQANVLANLGNVYLERSEFQPAADHFKRALEIHEEMGNRPGQAQQFSSLGLVHAHRADWDKAEEHHKKALAIHEQTGDRLGQAKQLASLALVAGIRGESGRASGLLNQAEALYEAIGAGGGSGQARARGAGPPPDRHAAQPQAPPQEAPAEETMITVLSGGVGAARFLQGLLQVVPQKDVTIVSNTGDDLEMFGLHVSPDIDIVIYHLAGLVNEEPGWGLAGDTFHALDALARFGHDTWFSLGDRDLATSIHRTHLLRQGRTMSEATAEIARAFGLEVTILPMTNDPLRTRVETPDGLIDFQEYLVKRRARDPFRGIKLHGIEDAKPAPGVIDAITAAEGVIIAPSNPIVSIGPILALPGVRGALRQTKARVVAVSPIVGGAVIKGPAAKMLKGLRMEVSAWQIGWLYEDFLDCLVIDNADAADRARIEALGLDVVVTDTIMKGMEEKAALARRVVEAIRGSRI